MSGPNLFDLVIPPPALIPQGEEPDKVYTFCNYFDQFILGDPAWGTEQRVASFERIGEAFPVTLAEGSRVRLTDVDKAHMMASAQRALETLPSTAHPAVRKALIRFAHAIVNAKRVVDAPAEGAAS